MPEINTSLCCGRDSVDKYFVEVLTLDKMSLLTLEAKLERQEPTTPWGFRMQGGKDFSSPITIARVRSEPHPPILTAHTKYANIKIVELFAL